MFWQWLHFRGRIENVPESQWLDADPCFVALGDTAIDRRYRYEALVRQAIPIDEIRLIRNPLQRGQ
jgi:putative transposase